MPLDLVDAVIGNLEANLNVTGPFGDTWSEIAGTGVAKFFSDISDQVPLPYTIITETTESYEYQMTVNGNTAFIATGQMRFDIYASARFTARALGWLIGKSLNDAPLYWPHSETSSPAMMFRLMSGTFIPVDTLSAAGAPIQFRRLLVFQYQYQASL